MTDCNQTLRDLYPYLDDELSDELKTHVHQHLESCTDCFGAFDFEAELKIAIRRKASNDELPPGLLQRLERCLDADLDTGLDGG